MHIFHGVKLEGGGVGAVDTGLVSPSGTGIGLADSGTLRIYADGSTARINANLQLGSANGLSNVGVLSTLTLSGNTAQDTFRNQCLFTGDGTSASDATVNGIGFRDRLNIASGHLSNYKAYTAGPAFAFDGTTTEVNNYYGFYVDNAASGVAQSSNFAFYNSSTAPSFSNGSVYVGGNTARNTRELWESTLTEEQKEELAAGTLAIPANVSDPGDGEFFQVVVRPTECRRSSIN